MRWGIGRYDYQVEPGLYAVGQPDEGSPVLVTANYKLSFDRLRRELGGLDLFILVLETMGINVWCAAGKGTFGTAELCDRIEAAGLAHVVSHRRLILPQLGAPGVAAHLVKERTGFRVKYGPVEAKDAPRFLADGRANEAMRQKDFPLGDRAALIPMELLPSLKYSLPLIGVMALFAAALGPAGSFLEGLWRFGAAAAIAVTVGVICGAVITPLLLPWVPGRAFALKGALVGAVVGAPLTLLGSGWLTLHPGWLWLDGLGLSLLGVALASFIAMNFTGTSTYTSLSGVEREMRWAVPMQAASAVVGLICWGASIGLLR